MLHALKIDQREAAPVSCIETRHGARAERDGDMLRVCAPDGAVLFQYDGATGQGTLHMPKKLRLETQGDIEMVAGGKLHMQAQEAETQFGSLVERIGNVYRYVKELQQVKAGRLRSLVKGAIQLKGERMSLLAREDVHIDGERINLG